MVRELDSTNMEALLGLATGVEIGEYLDPEERKAKASLCFH